MLKFCTWFQGGSAEEVAALREQCSTALKERAAIRVILDVKIRSLVAQLGRGLQELPAQVRPPSLANQRSHRYEVLHRVRYKIWNTG